MSWISISLADLNDARVAELVTALRTEALAQGQTDPMPRFVQDVVDEVRRAIAFHSSNPLDADTTKIPTGLKRMAVGEVVARMKARLQMALTDDEVRAEKRYFETLQRLQEGKHPVDTTDNPVATPPVQSSGGAEIVTNPGRTLTREGLSAL
jgi:hypothetical protein